VSNLASLPRRLISGSRAPGNHCICGWVGPTARFVAMGPEPHDVSRAPPATCFLPSYAGSFVTTHFAYLSSQQTDRWPNESMNSLGLNPRSKPDEQLRSFSNYSWCAFPRLRVLLLLAATVPTKLEASRITGNYNACCYNKRYRLCVYVCVGGGLKKRKHLTSLRIWRTSGGPL
jgi:hypothetical protein